MNTLDKQYQSLLQDILDNGVQKGDRTGTGTLSVFGRQIRHNMKEGFPLLTTKKMAWKSIVVELLWFLRGDTNIKYLVDNGCHIWDGDAWKRFSEVRKSVLSLKPPSSEGKLKEYIGWYEQVSTKEEFINKIKTDDEFAKKWGELGPVYGKQWRSWNKWSGKEVMQDFYESHIDEIDQIKNLINELKTNPDSRRLMVSAWNVGELDQMVLPPCHYGFQVYTRELSEYERGTLYDEKYSVNTDSLKSEKDYNKSNIPTRAISLMFNMRSTDVGLGLGFNLASYGLLLMMIAKQVNMIPYELVYNGGDVHLYLNHVEPIKEQLSRKPYPLPTVKISDRVVNDISEYTFDDFTLENYQYHPTIRMPLSN